MAILDFFRRFGRGGGGEALRYALFDTGLGEMAAATTPAGICRLQLRAAGSESAFLEVLREDHPGQRTRRDPGAFDDLRGQLEAYLAGELQDFTLPLDPRGTEFRLAVWEETRRIPYGATLSYGELAVRLGKPGSASRAVGNALGANPLPILIPCHRVLGRDGRLTGYGGGLDLKTRLLRIEGSLLL
jgi:O-6-methylguanine DNA methyltransferase